MSQPASPPVESLFFDLFMTLYFSNAQLNVDVIRGFFGPDFSTGLPPYATSSKEEFFMAVVESLQRRSLLDASLLEMLAKREFERQAAVQRVLSFWAAEHETMLPSNTELPASPTTGPQPEPGSGTLDELVLRFLKCFAKWGFNSSRVVRFGGRQPGFEMLADANEWDVFHSLQRLEATGSVRTFTSSRGTTLYKYRPK